METTTTTADHELDYVDVVEYNQRYGEFRARSKVSECIKNTEKNEEIDLDKREEIDYRRIREEILFNQPEQIDEAKKQRNKEGARTADQDENDRRGRRTVTSDGVVERFRVRD
ncbi:hypothetical protein LWI28_016166 [Acer negundo]|uniref:Uncharacterized protein n=1 Tax=Acer negundo TaxID=4023 RepID=A0AAD5IUF5_ACENE|nr:hypothetical protein LWI28_016166 [Acer negundo]